MLTATLLVSIFLGALIATRFTIWILLPALLLIVGLTVAIGISYKWGYVWILLAVFIDVVSVQMSAIAPRRALQVTSPFRKSSGV
jgi:hypothetical protein